MSGPEARVSGEFEGPRLNVDELTGFATNKTDKSKDSFGIYSTFLLLQTSESGVPFLKVLIIS